MSAENTKKMLEKSPMSGIAVPIAIILVGALIIFGVTKMLSSGRDHRDLVNDLHSKTFGNRWVAAYELSKFIASSKIPEQDIPWLITSLGRVYKDSIDQRTQNFIILALGALKNELTLPILDGALDSADKEIKYNAVIAISNLPRGIDFNSWHKLINFLKSDDFGLVQVSALALSQHKIIEAREALVDLLNTDNIYVKYSVATGLINFREPKIKSIVSDALSMKVSVESEFGLNAAQVENIKLNILAAIRNEKWDFFNAEIRKIIDTESNIKVSTNAREVLNLLKN
jgi:hypothetical protein